jgi:hypothetical protein
MGSVEFTGMHHVKLPVGDLVAVASGTKGCSATPSTGSPVDDGVGRGVGGRLPGTGVPWHCDKTRAGAGNAGFDPVSFAVADRTAAPAEAWTAHFGALGVHHYEIRRASHGWVADVYDPDRLTVRCTAP